MNDLNSNRGFGLTSAMIGMSIMSLTFLSYFAITSQQGKVNTSLSQNQDLLDLHSTVQMLLTNQAVCGSPTNFHGKLLQDLQNRAPLSLPGSPPQVIADVGQTYKSWEITESKLTDLVQVSPNSYILNYALSAKPLKHVMGAPEHRRTFRIQLRTSGSGITETVEDCAGGGWAQMVKVASGTLGSPTGSSIRGRPLSIDLTQHGFVPGQPFELVATVGRASGSGPQGIRIYKDIINGIATATCLARHCRSIEWFAQQVHN